MGNEAVGHACWLFRFEEQNPAVWCDRASWIRQQAINQLHNAESQDGEKDDLVSPGPVFMVH